MYLVKENLENKYQAIFKSQDDSLERQYRELLMELKRTKRRKNIKKIKECSQRYRFNVRMLLLSR